MVRRKQVKKGGTRDEGVAFNFRICLTSGEEKRRNITSSFGYSLQGSPLKLIPLGTAKTVTVSGVSLYPTLFSKRQFFSRPKKCHCTVAIVCHCMRGALYFCIWMFDVASIENNHASFLDCRFADSANPFLLSLSFFWATHLCLVK